MRNIKNIIHRNSIAKFNYYKNFHSFGVSFEEYCNFIYNEINLNEKMHDTNLFGIKIKRINAYSYVHTIEEIFKNKIYKFTSDKTVPVILDCGANIGLSSIFFKKTYPKAKIISFEPDDFIYKTCQENLNAFGFEDVQLINAAVWKSDGFLNFLSDQSLGGMIISNDEDYSGSKVPAIDLNNYLVEEIDFLKMDIEGAELDVLHHCQDNLHLVKNLFVEYHSNVEKPQELQKLLSILSNSGFRYYIKHAWDYMDQPFVDFKRFSSNPYDLQLNIFAYRI